MAEYHSEVDGSPVTWSVFDRDADIAVGERQMPHWDQPGALTFVTFRLADSMPRAVVQQWREEQNRWLHQHGLKGSDLAAVTRPGTLPEPLRRAFLKMRNQGWHESLDHCHGTCWLKDAGSAQMVADTLRYFDGKRYDLNRFVVMPNHVHVLVQMRAGFQLRQQCESWLRFSGRKLNDMHRQHGSCWQSEPFDHIVRSEPQFRYLQQYIDENPSKAKLRTGEYLLWHR